MFFLFGARCLLVFSWSNVFNFGLILVVTWIVWYPWGRCFEILGVIELIDVFFGDNPWGFVVKLDLIEILFGMNGFEFCEFEWGKESGWKLEGLRQKALS